jgi:hypothetical protein
LSKRAAHEHECPYTPIKCPFSDKCGFNGASVDAVAHLSAAHKVFPIPIQPSGSFFYKAKVG